MAVANVDSEQLEEVVLLAVLTELSRRGVEIVEEQGHR